jgi:predicted component of type VI protein secretion system
MSWNNKVVWSEGLFLRPQHFQQSDRYFEKLVRSRVDALRPYAWGITDLTINRDLLGLGKIAVDEGRGIFEDGTPFATASYISRYPHTSRVRWKRLRPMRRKALPGSPFTSRK